MILDLRSDAKDFRRHLEAQVGAFVARAGKSGNGPKVSAIGVGYEFAQSGWIVVYFDTRAEHDRDGEWTNFKEEDVFERPQWFALVEALAYFSDDEGQFGPRKAAEFIGADGKKMKTGELSEEEFSAALGEMLKGVVLQAKADGVFKDLPKSDQCQIDVEEFNGTWAWPEYEELGKSNLV